jgi:hypothetical protein
MENALSFAEHQESWYTINYTLGVFDEIYALPHSTPDLSRRHHLHPFSQKLRCEWENI